MRLELLQRLNAERAARRPAVLVTELPGGEQRLVTEDQVATDPLAEALGARLRAGRSGTVEVADRRYFLAVQEPPVRLLAIGAVHISQALAALARIAGLDVTVIDPRTAFATPERFGATALVAAWPQEAFAQAPLDRFTAVAALTHDPRIDDPALDAALRAGCFYVGALGSRKSHAARVGRLAGLGHAAETLGRIHAPIGLDIGAVSPPEIAVSILAEIIASLRRTPPRGETGAPA